MKALSALHRLLTESLLATDDMMKTINTLIKYNKGLWKSAKQGKFILASTKDHRNAGAEEWAKKQPEYNPKTTLPVGMIKQLDQFGHKDVSKQRFYGLFALLDGHGVVRAAKPKIDHSVVDGNRVALDTIPGREETIFVREGDGPSDNYVSVAGETLDAIAGKKQKSQLVVGRIKRIPGWQSKQILHSFIAQLEGGKSLSKRQLDVLSKFENKGDSGFDGSDFQVRVDMAKKLIRSIIIPALDTFIAERDVDPAKYKKWFRTFGSDISSREGRIFINVIERLRRDNELASGTIDTRISNLEEIFEIAENLVGKQGKLTKKEWAVVKYISTLVRTLKKIDDKSLRRAIMHTFPKRRR